MARVYHSDIFYPSDKNELMALSQPLEKRDSKRAVIVPHMDLRRCYRLYQEAFRYIPDSSRIIALIPIHGERLEKDSSSIAFEGDEEIVSTLGPIHIEQLGLEKAPYYQEEEFSAELLLPYYLISCPHSTLSIVYVKAESADESKKLARLIEKWNNNNTFFIISSNLTGILKENELQKEKEKAIGLLENGDKLLDQYRKGHISICAAPIIDALSRVIPGKWKMISTLDDTITGHAAFYKEEK